MEWKWKVSEMSYLAMLGGVKIKVYFMYKMDKMEWKWSEIKYKYIKYISIRYNIVIYY